MTLEVSDSPSTRAYAFTESRSFRQLTHCVVQMILALVQQTFEFPRRVTDGRKLRLRKVVHGQEAWVRMANNDWPAFLRPGDVVAVFSMYTVASGS
jgi:hypothetical protein